LGIRLERITPGKPQENGRHERFHRTLAEAVASPARANARAQQRALDLFRREYNEDRPHEALGQKPPAVVYAASTRRYPCGLLQPTGTAFGHLARVDRHGAIRWRHRRPFISSALIGAYVQLDPDAGARWAVHFGDILLGHIDDAKPTAGLLTGPRPRKSHVLELRPRVAPATLTPLNALIAVTREPAAYTGDSIVLEKRQATQRRPKGAAPRDRRPHAVWDLQRRGMASMFAPANDTIEVAGSERMILSEYRTLCPNFGQMHFP
jgi:hypothetical protein